MKDRRAELAVPVKYDGIQFKSKLEARWYVALRDMGFQPEYEPLTLELASGRYTPDFQIKFAFWHPELKPDPECFEFYVEIKPWKVKDRRHIEVDGLLLISGNIPEIPPDIAPGMRMWKLPFTSFATQFATKDGLVDFPLIQPHLWDDAIEAFKNAWREIPKGRT